MIISVPCFLWKHDNMSKFGCAVHDTVVCLREFVHREYFYHRLHIIGGRVLDAFLHVWCTAASEAT